MSLDLFSSAPYLRFYGHKSEAVLSVDWFVHFKLLFPDFYSGLGHLFDFCL